MPAKKTQLQGSAPHPIDRRRFLGAVGLGGVALLGGLAPETCASARATPPRYALVAFRLNQTYSLHAGINRIGRDPTGDIVLPEQYISRRHCVVCVSTGGTLELRDTNSRNGTFVNGQRVKQPVRLVAGDVIRICDRVLFLVDQTNPPQPIENGQPVPGTLQWAEANDYLKTAMAMDWL